MQVARFDPFFKRLFAIVAIGIGLWLIYLLIPVILPFLGAFILAYLLNPIVARLARIMPRWLSILIVYTAIIFGFVALLWWLLPTLWIQIESAWQYFPRLVEWYNSDMRIWVNDNSRFN